MLTLFRRGVLCHAVPLLQVPETKGMTLEEISGETVMDAVDPEDPERKKIATS
jgi:hypothetical protein